MTLSSNPLVAELEKGAAALAKAIDTSDGKSTIDALESFIVNTVVRCVAGMIPGAQLVSGPIAEALVAYAQESTNKGLDSLGAAATPTPAPAPSSPSSPGTTPAAPADPAPTSGDPKEGIIASIVGLLRKL